MDNAKIKIALDKIGFSTEGLTDKEILFVYEETFAGARAKLRIAIDELITSLEETYLIKKLKIVLQHICK